VLRGRALDQASSRRLRVFSLHNHTIRQRADLGIAKHAAGLAQFLSRVLLVGDREGAQTLAAGHHEVAAVVARNPHRRPVRLGYMRTQRRIPQKICDLIEKLFRSSRLQARGVEGASARSELAASHGLVAAEHFPIVCDTFSVRCACSLGAAKLGPAYASGSYALVPPTHGPTVFCAVVRCRNV
jgi:hypothetical protein